jgi:hypothetical protein
MAVKESIEHIESKRLLEVTEKENGFIETYRIQLKHDLKPGAWLDLPEGDISAVKVKVDGIPKYMFNNPMDNYFRATLVDVEDVNEGAELIQVDTPYAHAEALADDKIRDRTLSNERAMAKANEDARHRLVGLNALSEHYGFEPVEKYSIRFQQLSNIIEKIAEFQGGKLNFSSLPKARTYNELPINEQQQFSIFDPKLFSPDVMKGLRQLAYRAQYKHDVGITQHDDHVDVKIFDAKGKVLSNASLPFCLGEEEFHSHKREDIEDVVPLNFSFIPEIIKTKAHDEADFQPMCVERGRPLKVEDSRFAKVYESLEFMTFIPGDFLDVVNGLYTEKGLGERFESQVRYNLSRTGIAQEVADFLKPKREAKLESGVSLSA